MPMAPLLRAATAALLASAALGAAVPARAPAACASVKARVDCTGGANVSETNCVARGCCFDASPQGPNATSCYFAADGKGIKTVHVISSNHFDAGYADITASVINMYFDKYYPQAASVGAALKAATGQSLKWMTFSYIISLYLDCPPGMGLHCPNASALATFKQAVTDRHIVWPSLPTNAELAAADPSALRFGVHMSNVTADTLEVPRPRTLSTRDVPGMPRSAVPVLVDAGVRALTEGMNGRMVPVNVPPAFRWKDPESGKSILTLWHWHGYGMLVEPGHFLQVPGSEHALAYNWRGDNAGPPMTASETQKDFATIQASFPGAAVVSSTFDEFVDAITAEGADALLPEITKDLADTWVWGMASDPQKLMRMRAIHRARTACEAAGTAECTAADPRYYNLSRLAQKNIEHTWGVSVFHYGKEANADWGNAKFHAALADNSSVFSYMVSSWVEQRRWGVDFPVDNLRGGGGASPHPLLPLIEAEFAAMTPPAMVDPSTQGFSRGAAGEPVALPGGGPYTSVTVDAAGAVVALTSSRAGRSVASESNRLGLLAYQTLVEDDFATFQNEYLIHGSGGQNEFGKPSSFMLATPTPKRRLENPTLTALWHKGGTVLADVTFSSESHTEAGAPEMARINYTVTPSGLAVELTLVNKTATRLPESIYFGFNPVGSGTGTWAMDKLGTSVNPLDVADGASRGMHCVTSGVELASGGVTTVLGSPDVAVARWDVPLPFPTPLHRQPDLSKGVNWNLYNNIWNTNYPFWWPFVPGDETTKFRFTVEEH